jgi:anaphase-promoting complex subunit 1
MRGRHSRPTRYIYGGREEKNGAYIGYGGTEMGVNKVKSSLVLEPAPGNVDITSPGATLALGLMWLKSNSSEEAARIQIPDTRFLLMSVRPDLLLIRVLSKGLILWNSIEPSDEWVMRQLPAILLRLPPR